MIRSKPSFYEVQFRRMRNFSRNYAFLLIDQPRQLAMLCT